MVIGRREGPLEGRLVCMKARVLATGMEAASCLVKDYSHLSDTMVSITGLETPRDLAPVHSINGG